MFASTNMAEVSIHKLVSRLTASYSILTVTLFSSECCVPSGLHFETTSGSVVRYFVSNYLLRGLRVIVNMTWALFHG